MASIKKNPTTLQMHIGNKTCTSVYMAGH